MNNNVKQIIDKYRFDGKIKYYTNKHFFKDKNIIHRQINNREDIKRAKNEIEYDLDYYSKIYPLVREDIEQIERSLGKYEIAICKVLQCYGLNDFDYSAEELQELIDNRIDKYEIKLNELKMRLMCQD